MLQWNPVFTSLLAYMGFTSEVYGAQNTVFQKIVLTAQNVQISNLINNIFNSK